jgi:hypothetical protein
MALDREQIGLVYRQHPWLPDRAAHFFVHFLILSVEAIRLS